MPTEAAQSTLECVDEKSASGVGAFAAAFRVANQINRSCTIVAEVVLKKTQNVFRAVETRSWGLWELLRRQFALNKGSGGESDKQKLHNRHWGGTQENSKCIFLVFVFVVHAVETRSRPLLERSRRRFELRKGRDMSAVNLW
eukprot:scaffold155482_cov58-Attheya_sp.AAC.4